MGSALCPMEAREGPQCPRSPRLPPWGVPTTEHGPGAQTGTCRLGQSDIRLWGCFPCPGKAEQEDGPPGGRHLGRRQPSRECHRGRGPQVRARLSSKSTTKTHSLWEYNICTEKHMNYEEFSPSDHGFVTSCEIKEQDPPETAVSPLRPPRGGPRPYVSPWRPHLASSLCWAGHACPRPSGSRGAAEVRTPLFSLCPGVTGKPLFKNYFLWP